MYLKKLLFLSLVALVYFYNFSFAGELASREAFNYYNEGLKAQKVGDTKEAVIAYQNALLCGSGNIELKKKVYNNLGVLHVKEGDFVKAEKAFLEALSLDPHYKTARLNLGLVYETVGSYSLAEEQWFKAVEEIKPKDFALEEPQQIEQLVR